MRDDRIAKASVTVDASPTDVWDALVTPARIKEYMFGAEVDSQFRPGSPIRWKGEWQGRSYEDKGAILQASPGRLLQYTHFSPLSGLPDTPENYHTVTIELTGAGSGTRVALTQDNNPTAEALEHSEQNWATMLRGLKRHLEADA
jgi:uncharacterized protein YndB with AHSA1/START domain